MKNEGGEKDFEQVLDAEGQMAREIGGGVLMWNYFTAPDRRDALLTVALLVVVAIVVLGGVIPGGCLGLDIMLKLQHLRHSSCWSFPTSNFPHPTKCLCRHLLLELLRISLVMSLIFLSASAFVSKFPFAAYSIKSFSHFFFFSFKYSFYSLIYV